jgi:hypothetical protein
MRWLLAPLRGLLALLVRLGHFYRGDRMGGR